MFCCSSKATFRQSFIFLWLRQTLVKKDKKKQPENGFLSNNTAWYAIFLFYSHFLYSYKVQLCQKYLPLVNLLLWKLSWLQIAEKITKFAADGEKKEALCDMDFENYY